MQGAHGEGFFGDTAHQPAWLPMRPAASIPPFDGVDVSPPTPCGTGGPGPRGRAPPGPTSPAPTAMCGSSAAITLHAQVSGLGAVRGLGPGCLWWSHGDWWRRWAWVSPRSPAPSGCAESGRGAGVRGHVDTQTRTVPRGWVGSVQAAIAGRLVDVGIYWGLVGGWGRCW